MVKYKVEGDIQFYTELSNLLNNKEEDSSNLCLISNLPLDENSVKLECGHSFNYLSIYKDIKNHKQKYNSMEMNTCILKTEQIRCPYCRNIQNKLLPYIEMNGIEKIHGINWIDENYMKYNITFIGKCCYKELNIYFDENLEETPENNPKLILCEKVYVTKLKENGLDYCNQHKGFVLNQIINQKKKMEKIKEQEAKLLEKEAKVKAKLLEKEDKVKVKLLEKEIKLKEKILEKFKQEAIKLKEKDIKQKAKLLEKENKVEVTNENVCVAILKSGLNKGLPCGKIIFENNKCKRHCKITL